MLRIAPTFYLSSSATRQNIQIYKYFSTNSLNKSRRSTASAVIIGNEILTGKTQDTNTNTLAKILFDVGVDLVRTETILDVESDIVETIQRLSPKVDYLFTSGGIGPTHDDITYAAIAKAFNCKLILHEPTVEKMSKMSTYPINDARKRMATIPEGSKILETIGLWVPLVVIKNVYILPGVPGIFTKMIEHNRNHFKSEYSVKLARKFIYTTLREGDFADPLRDIANKYPQVFIGSYPKNDYVTLSIEGENAILVESVGQDVKKAVSGVEEKDKLIVNGKKLTVES